MSDQETEEPVVFRKINRKRPVNARKPTQVEKPAPKEADEENSDEESSEEATSGSNDEAGPIKVKRGLFSDRNKRLRKNPLMQKSKKRANPQGNEESGSESSSADSSSSNEERQKALDIDDQIKSSRTAQSDVPRDMGATKVSEVDTERDKDYQAQFERVQKELEEKGAQPGTSGEKIYRGLKMYGAKAAKDTVKGKASSGLNHYGPIRNQQFMRASVRWDFAPDICKDYKETGFCTFGDSCKFLHDRSDYKHGWEIEAEWQKQQAEKNKQEEDYTIDSDED
ncbi:unnamed protein product [Bursaphelenchus xylophilus]|uniref:(pine wood nematode) hypothetical protein n=1 Tax=Bursaphelenchus xylophilus TaxID=6326 RepID=A0A1I7SBH5_BURXY|nr:unnamed protein product [Bursaphelenchus xylophilus]CAG9121991.1 unnamed protein product [Bursaphelenchus xylophilus]